MYLCAGLLCAGSVSPLRAQTTARAEITAVRLTRPPTIDGLLDDEAWQTAPAATGDWRSYDPLYGDPIPQSTTVWVGYDSDAIYIAFKCDDPEPQGIKTSVTRRDNIWQDDWVGLSLDALGTGQLAYHMMVNPSGVQADMLNSVADGEDQAPDWIWDSAGHLTPTGYSVEIRLPLQSIRISGGANARMGILFWRRVSRLGMSVSWPALAPGRWVFEQNAGLRVDDIRPRLARELLPSVTYARTEQRATPSLWTPASNHGDVGFGGKIGLTPTITLDATVNPDFSQVESDAYQVEVNQRFPVFYSEKRPFFMEGAGVFALAGMGGDNSLQRAVHSRRIIDPIFGAKLTGSAGRVTFATLSAVDEAAGRDLPAGARGAGDNRLFTLGRVQYSLGPSNYAGALFTDASFAGGFNRVVGADYTWRLSPTQRITGFALASRTKSVDDGTTTAGEGAQLTYAYDTQKYYVNGSFEHYDRGFQMATAFLNRVGITAGWLFAQRNFYPDRDKYGWVRRISLLSFTQGGRDRVNEGDDFLEVAGVRANFTRQGFIRADRSVGREPWLGRRFERGRWRLLGEIQAYRWLRLDGRITAGRAVLYDLVDPFQGRSRETQIGTTLQPNGRLSEQLSYERVTFDREATGARVYTLDIVNSKTTYQFTRAFSVRGLVRYDSSRRRILTDLLSSYEPRPGTVVYLGYGSLIERHAYDENRWVPAGGDYRTMQRGFFFKTSYLYRF